MAALRLGPLGKVSGCGDPALGALTQQLDVADVWGQAHVVDRVARNLCSGRHKGMRARQRERRQPAVSAPLSLELLCSSSSRLASHPTNN